MDPAVISKNAIKSIALTIPDVPQHTVNGEAVLRRLLKILGLTGIKVRINQAEGRPRILELVGQVELMLINAPDDLSRDGVVATRDLIAKIKATPRKKLTKEIAQYISNPQVFRAINARMGQQGLIDLLIYFAQGSEDRIRSLLEALVRRGGVMGVNDPIHQFGDLIGEAEVAADEAEEKGGPDPVLEILDEQRLAEITMRAKLPLSALSSPPPEDLTPAEASMARADALPTGTADASGARGTGQLGALGGEPLPPDEEKKSNIPEKAVELQQNIEASGGGVDQGRGLVQSADIGDEAKYDSVNNAVANQLALDNNQGFDPRFTQPVQRAPVGSVPESKEELQGMISTALGNIDQLILQQIPPSWDDIANEFDPDDLADLVEVKQMADDSQDILADQRARWVASNWQPGLPISALVLLAGFLSSSPSYKKSAQAPGALSTMLAALSSIAYRSQVGLDNLKPASPFGDQGDPDRRGLNDRVQDGGAEDGGGMPRPPGVGPPAGDIPEGAVPAGDGYWGRVARLVMGTAAGADLLGWIYEGAKFRPTGGGMDEPGDVKDPGADPREREDDRDKKKIRDRQERRFRDRQERRFRDKGKKRKEDARPAFTETPIVVQQGQPPKNGDLRPEFTQVGSGLLDLSNNAQKKDEYAFAAFNKVLPHFGDVSDMARASEARRFNNTIKAPQKPLTRRDVVEIMQTFLKPMRPDKLSQYGDPRALGQVTDITINPDLEPKPKGVREMYGYRPNADELAFPWQTTDGLPKTGGSEGLLSDVILDAPPVDNKRLPDVSIQSLQPVGIKSGYQDWYVSNTVVNPAEATSRSRYPSRTRNTDTGPRGYTFEDGRGWAVRQWPVRGAGAGGPALPPFVENSRPVTNLKQTANPEEMSYNRSMSWQTGTPSVFKPLPFT